MSEKELLADKQKRIINKIVTHLSNQGTSMYYESTINVCHMIEDIIKAGDILNKDEKDAVKNLSAKDIQNNLSYNSSCC